MALQDYLRILKSSRRGGKAGLDRKRLDAIEGAILALARGDNITVERGIKKWPSELKVRLGVRKQKSNDYGVAEEDCVLGSIYDPDDGEFTKAILGGPMICGDKNFQVPYYGIETSDDGTADGQWLMEIKLSGVTPATDDDDSIFLPGIVTATGTPTWNAIAYTGSEDYTDTTNPANPGDTGEAVAPIGLITVVNRTVEFYPVACGQITVEQCAGIISVGRGG